MVVDRAGDVVTRDHLDRRLDQLAADVDAKLDRFAADFTGRLDRLAADLDQQASAFDGKLDAQANRLMAAWRRDLLLIAVPQFVALVAILMGVGS